MLYPDNLATAYILRALITKGAPFQMFPHTITVAGKTTKPATIADFDTYRIDLKQYQNKADYQVPTK